MIIYAVENHPKYGAKCRKILEDMEAGKLEVCCSTLVLIEVINILVKINKILKGSGERELDIRKNIDAILSLPIQWIEVSPMLIRRASEYEYPVSGVDYVHLASMELNGVEDVISADKELDKVVWVKRVDPLRYA